MQWWNDFIDWLNSIEGWQLLTDVVFPFLAIVVAGFVAAMIGRGATKRVIAHRDREQRVSTVAALIGAARRATQWNTLSLTDQQHTDHLAHEADISTRLLPLAGSSMAADWAAHEIAEMKRDSVSFSFQAEQSLIEFRDRLVTWQGRPSRAKKLFKSDLDQWAFDSAQEDKGLVQKQQEWAKQQVAAETGPISTVEPAATRRSEPAAVPTPTVPAPPSAAPTPGVVPPPAAPPGQTLARDAAPPEALPAPTAAAPASPTPPPSSPSSTGEDDPAFDGPGEPETPNPVSAQSVRQRAQPADSDEDWLR